MSEEDNPKKEDVKEEAKGEKADSEEKKEEAPKVEPKVEDKPAEKPEAPKHKPAPKQIKKDYKLKTVSEKKNPLMKRTEYMFQVVHSAQPTPVRVYLTKDIAKVLKVKEDGILIEKIFSERGRAESNAKVFVYKDKKDIPKYKLDKLEKRMTKKKGETVSKPAETLSLIVFSPGVKSVISSVWMDFFSK